MQRLLRYQFRDSFKVEEHNRRQLNTLEIGDAIEFERGYYSHWAIYLGNGQIIHVSDVEIGCCSGTSNFSRVSSEGDKSFKKAEVLVSNFDKETKGCYAFKNNSKDERFPPRPVAEIIRTARSMEGPIDYNLLKNNCEHFVSLCRNRVPISDQDEQYGPILYHGVAIKYVKKARPSTNGATPSKKTV